MKFVCPVPFVSSALATLLLGCARNPPMAPPVRLAPQAPAVALPADLILRGGTILTLEPASPVVSALGA